MKAEPANGQLHADTVSDRLARTLTMLDSISNTVGFICNKLERDEAVDHIASGDAVPETLLDLSAVLENAVDRLSHRLEYILSRL